MNIVNPEIQHGDYHVGDCQCLFPWLHPKRHMLKTPGPDLWWDKSLYPDWRAGIYANGEPRPVLRGVLHEAFSIVTAFYTAALVYISPSDTARVASAVFGGLLVSMFVISGQFHRRNFALTAYNLMKRFDHSAIFLLSAGSSSIPALALLQSGMVEPAIALFAFVWIGAITGCIYNFTKKLGDKVAPFGLFLMAVTGGCKLPFVYWLYTALAPVEFWCIVAGWGLFLSAIVVYSTHRGDFVPQIWGYHETFHVITVLAISSIMFSNWYIIARLGTVF